VASSGRHPGRTPSRTVRYITLGAIALALLAATTACSDDSSDADEPPTTTTEPAPIPDRRPFGVGSHTETLVDDSRTTPAFPDKGIEAAGDRTIGLTVLYPTDAEEPPTDDGGIVDGIDPPPDTDDATPAEGPFPLLVFAHGWNGSGDSLVAPAKRWASAGYVVALPTFPLSQEGIATDVDVANQPGDVSFVIDTLLERSDDPDGPLAGSIDADRIAVGGHSLGSATVFGFENSCCEDPRVKAIVAVSGGPLPYPTGTYDAEFATPMLLVHGGEDPGVNPAISEAVFIQTPGKMALLMLDAGTHTSHFGGADGAVLDEVLVAFLDRELDVDSTAWDGLEEEVAASGRGSLRSKDS